MPPATLAWRNGSRDRKSERQLQRRRRNWSTVSPASLTIPPMVTASTGSWRGTVRIRCPSVMTMCLPCLATQNPLLSSTRTAGGAESREFWAWRLCGYVYFYFSQVLFPGELPGNLDVVADRGLNIGQRFFFRSPLAPAPGESGAGDAIAFICPDQSDGVLHGPTLARGRPLSPLTAAT